MPQVASHIPSQEQWEKLLLYHKELETALVRCEEFLTKGLVAPINELRGTFYHIFSYMGKGTEEELLMAEEHLNRAVKDALQLLANYLVTSITQKLQALPLTFSVEGLARLTRIELNLAHIRNGELVTPQNPRCFEIALNEKEQRQFNNIISYQEEIAELLNLARYLKIEKEKAIKGKKRLKRIY